MNSLDCKKPVPCPPPTTQEKEIYPAPSPEFTVCVGDYSLQWDGSRLYKTRPRNTADGEYGSVTLVNGCVTSYGETEVPSYTPPYCNPNPAPCGDGSAGNAATPISPTAGNSLTTSALGLYSRTYVQAGGGATVEGSGTASKPYIISAGGSSSTQVVASARIKVEELIPNQYTISLRENALPAGTYGGFSVDKYGAITGYTTVTTDVAIASIIEGTDISIVTSALGVVKVSHALVGEGIDSYLVGDSEITISATGHVLSIEKAPPETRRRPLLDFYRIEVRVPLPVQTAPTEAVPSPPIIPIDYDLGFIEVEAYDAAIVLVSRENTAVASTYVLQLNNYILGGQYVFGATASVGSERTVVTPAPDGKVTIKVTHGAGNTSALLARIGLTIREA